MGYSPWDCKELDMTEGLTFKKFAFLYSSYIYIYVHILYIYVCVYIYISQSNPKDPHSNLKFYNMNYNHCKLREP